MADMKPVAWACWFDDQDPNTDDPHVLTHEPKAYAQRRPLVYGDDVAAQLEQARREEREACAKVCEKSKESIWEFHEEIVKEAGRNVCDNLASTIRARGEA